MTLHFINYESALRSIEESTKQLCNHFTVLHYITNGYLNLYFKYSGELYKKSYNSIVSEKFDENDFTIMNTEKVNNLFLQIKMSSLIDEQLYQIFNNEQKIKVGNVHKLDGAETYHLLQDDNHVNVNFYDEELFNSYIDMLLECHELSEKLIALDSNGKELSQFNRYEYLGLNELYFSSEEIEELINLIQHDRRTNLYSNRERDLSNRLLIKYFADQIVKTKPTLSKMKQAEVIKLAMDGINRPMAVRTIRDHLKEKMPN